MINDITERKQGEETAKTMLDNVVMGISMISPKMEVLWLNKTFRKWFPTIDPEKKPLCYQSFYSPPKEEICDYCPTIKTFKTGQVHSSETGICVDGKIYNVIAAPVKDEKGEITYVVETVEDITERKQAEEALRESEEKYRDLYDNAPDMYHSLDKNGIIIDCNETEARMLGYKKEEIIGRPITDFFTEESKGLFERDFPKLNKEKVQLNLEREFVRKDGTTLPASLNVFSEFDEDGKLIRTKTIARDVTERKKAEDELMKKMNELERINRLMVGRELRMKELKGRIKELEARIAKLGGTIE